MAFRGGYAFRHFEGCAAPSIGELPFPGMVRVSFPSWAGTDGRLLVGEGSAVRAGTPLIEAQGVIIPAPAGGIVEKAGDGSVVIRTDGDPVVAPVHGHPRSPVHMGRGTLLETFRTSGCALLFAGRFAKVEDFEGIRHVIVNAVHNGPLDQAWKPELFDTGLFVDGMGCLRALFPSATVTIAVNRRNHGFFSSPTPETFTIFIASDRYPQEFPEILRRDILRLPVELDDAATVVIPFLDVIDAAECMTRGRPLVTRTLLIAGPGVSKPGWYRVRIGTPISHLRRHLFKTGEHGPWRVIRGNPLTGKAAVDDETVEFCDREITVIREHAERDLYRFLNPGFDWDSYSRLTVSSWLPVFKRRLDTNVHGGVRPCVQCTFCDDACPVGIHPHVIWKGAAMGAVEETFRLRPHHCVGCGLCDYVCPSKIDLSRSVRAARDAYREAAKP